MWQVSSVRSLARSRVRALPSHALNFMPLAAICTYKQRRARELVWCNSRLCVRAHVQAARINERRVDRTLKIYARHDYIALRDAVRRGELFFRESRARCAESRVIYRADVWPPAHPSRSRDHFSSMPQRYRIDSRHTDLFADSPGQRVSFARSSRRIA